MKKDRFKAMCVILAGLLCVLAACAAPTDRLSPEEIEVLRKTYPLCGTPDLVDGNWNVPVEEYIERANTFVYGEVQGEVKYFTDERTIAAHEFYSYTLSVLEDSEGIYEKGTEVTLYSNVLLENMTPKLQDGMRILAAFKAETEDEKRSSIPPRSLFYVTKDGYVLSTFNETDTGTKLPLSGMPVEEALKVLQKNQ